MRSSFFRILIFIGVIIILIIVGFFAYFILPKGRKFFSNEYISPMIKTLDGKKIVMIIAFRDFRDEEYFVPREILKKVGVEIKTASNKKGVAVGADGGEVNVDLLISEIDVADFDAIIFVGGPGCLSALDNEYSYRIIREAVSQDKILAAICISPVILAKAGVLKGKKATVWTSPLDKNGMEILQKEGAIYQEEPVVVDGKIITANGPQSAKLFGEKILEVIEK